MKILYAIQGTGNGHLTRAKEIIPILKEKEDDVIRMREKRVKNNKIIQKNI